MVLIRFLHCKVTIFFPIRGHFDPSFFYSTLNPDLLVLFANKLPFCPNHSLQPPLLSEPHYLCRDCFEGPPGSCPCLYSPHQSPPKCQSGLLKALGLQYPFPQSFGCFPVVLKILSQLLSMVCEACRILRLSPSSPWTSPSPLLLPDSLPHTLVLPATLPFTCRFLCLEDGRRPPRCPSDRSCVVFS